MKIDSDWIVYLIDNIRAKSNDVPVEDLGHFWLFARFTQSNVVDKRSITTARVQDKESFIFVDDHGMLSRQHLTVKQSISGITLKKKKVLRFSSSRFFAFFPGKLKLSRSKFKIVQIDYVFTIFFFNGIISTIIFREIKVVSSDDFIQQNVFRNFFLVKYLKVVKNQIMFSVFSRFFSK